MKSSKRSQKGTQFRRKAKGTKGRDNMVSNTGRKDYFVANALEITPHPNQKFVAVLGQPIMDRRLKYSILETSISGSSATSTTPTSLLTVAQGTTDITRTGDRIRAKRIWLSGKLYGNAAATAPVATRVLVVLWQPLGNAAVNAPVASQVIQHSAGYGPYGSYSRDYGDGFQVIYDSVFSVNPVGANSEAEMIHIDRELLIDCEFGAGGTTPVTNAFYIFLLSDVGANQPSLNFSSTVWWDDLDA